MMAVSERLIMVYIPCASHDEATAIAQQLLEERIIACANIHPIQSRYWWENELQTTNEVVIVGKTTEALFDRVVSYVEQHHSYDVPCIMKIAVDANERYAAWLRSCLKQ